MITNLQVALASVYGLKHLKVVLAEFVDLAVPLDDETEVTRAIITGLQTLVSKSTLKGSNGWQRRLPAQQPAQITAFIRITCSLGHNEFQTFQRLN
jgi:hypothetical protein